MSPIKRRGDAEPDDFTLGTTVDHTGVGLGWEEAPTEFTRRVCFTYIYGDTGTGRTHLALTAPGPIGLAHTAEKVEGVVQEFARQKQIRMVNFGGLFKGSPQEIANQAAPVWNKMVTAWNDAMDNWAKSVIMDTDTEGWEMLRLARLGSTNPKGRTDALYGPVNAEWRSLFKRYRLQSKCNVVSIGQAKDEYRDVVKGGQVSSERTGRTIRAGQKEMGYMADVIIRTSRTDDWKFKCTIEKGWWNAHIEGMEFEDEECRLPYILSLITDTDESEWT